MGYQEHQQRVANEGPGSIRCGILTISDTRDASTDTSGASIRQALDAAGHSIVGYAIVKDDAAAIVAEVRRLEQAGCQVIISNGGTGIARRDSTFEAIDALLEKRLPGFGELFRMLSYQDIGAAAMFSRATAGLYGRAVIFVLPGSQGAVRLAMERLILPELGHLIWETLRQDG
jgi:molybdenum cofactor biosynthesis protein B